jgi:DNA replication protein DnaC
MRRDQHYIEETRDSVGGPVLAVTVLDRILLHHFTVINIKRESYRPKDSRKNSLPTMKKERKK